MMALRRLLMLLLPLAASALKGTIPLQNLGLPGLSSSFDYIVVGGGTSGLAIATRLAQDKAVTVAIVEVGGLYEIESGLYSIVPGFAAAANTGTDPSDDNMLIDWNFDTITQMKSTNRVMRYARGKALGGTSARNFCAFHRPTKGSLDQWASLTGDESWSWVSVYPLYKKSTTVTPPNMAIRQSNASVSYNTGAFDNSLKGPLQVTWPNWGSPLSSWVDDGLEAIGIERDVDLYSGSLNGSGWAAGTINPSDQTRDSSETSYLQLVLGQLNLKVYLHTMALKLQFSGTTTTGVEVETIGIKYTLKAKKEVIVSAGAFQSPQLLMVSGIGPQAALQSKGISVVKNLPGVGKNMWDHMLFGVVNRVNVITATSWLNDALAAAANLAQYLVQKGPLTATGFGTIGFEILSDSTKKTFSNATQSALAAAGFPSDWPEFEYLGLDGILAGWNSADDQDTPDQANYGSIGGSLLSPLSRGSVTISSANMKDPPIIDPNWLSHPADQELVVHLFKRIRAAWEATGVTIGEEYKPGLGVSTDEQILAYIKSTTSPVWHPSGTCKMGKTSDPDAVVDSHGRVIGISKLRVVDASIFPTLPPGHPQSTCYMVAEKIAADIKAGN